MIRFEYRVISQHEHNIVEVTQQLNALGREGFRVIQFKVDQNDDHSHTVWFVLERPLTERA